MTLGPDFDCTQVHPSLPVRDIRTAVDFYAASLGFATTFTYGEPPTMAGVTMGHIQVFLQQDGAPHPVMVYFVVSEADALHDYQRARGVAITEPLGDREYGLRDYTVRDLDGNHLTFGHPLFNAGEPIPVERVDVPVRLEKRLAAVLKDLAELKRMTLTSCLEETLLHTFEPLGDGVASPHTSWQLRRIQELKRKHGIDYDSHGSYRFVEGDPKGPRPESD